MRILGYALLILGFIATPFWFAANFHALCGEIAHRSDDLVRGDGEAKTYTWPECKDVLIKAIRQTGNSIPVLCLPVISMLIGGIVLDLSGRWHKKTKAQPNNSPPSEPPVASP